MAAKKSRIREPSTWSGIGGVLLAAASLPLPDDARAWFAGMAGVAGAVAIWMREAA